MKKHLFTSTAFLILTFSFFICDAQSWKWAMRGGGKTSSGTPDEEFRSLALDKNGNTYSLARIHTDKVSGDIDIDGNKLGKGNGSHDIILFSFDCSGKYRWSKVIGSKLSDNAYTVKTDTLGGVYLVGNFVISNLGDSVFFDKDTAFGTTVSAPKKFYKSLFIVKYDTLGNYKWLRMPEPDSLSGPRNSSSFSMDISPDGTTSILGYIGSSGAFANGAYVVPTSSTFPSIHILKYDRNGNFIKGFPMEISEGDFSSLTKLRMAWDAKNDVYYTHSLNLGGTGVNYPKFGSIKMTGTNCLAKFSSTGINIWVKQSSTTWYTGTLSTTPVIDGDGNIYLGTSEGPGGNFNGYTATNTLSGANTVPLVIKLNSSGTNLWGFNGSSSIFANGSCISVSGNGEVAFSGNWVGNLKFGGITSASVKSDLFLVRLNSSTGAMKSFDSLKSGDVSLAVSLACDKKGNFYLGGTINSTLAFPSIGTLNKYGGASDFFIAKFGEADCNAPVSISEQLISSANLKIYPNPTSDKLTLEGLIKGASISLFNIVGQQVYNGKAESLMHQLSLNGLTNGIYLLQIKTASGDVYNTKIVKQ